MTKILIANRGEIALRLAEAVVELGMVPVAVYSEDDKGALHVRRAQEAIALNGQGARAYLDIAGMIAAAEQAGAQAIHPGYGFLSESAEFARAVAAAGMVFIGPSPEALEELGDKTRARQLAQRVGAPVNPGLDQAADPEAFRAFMQELGGDPIVLKAVAGGGGRGMRIVREAAELADAFEAASAEAAAAFGNPAIYAERFLENARHIEVQVLADGTHAVHLWERDCTLQRRHQKLIEIAPAPALAPDMRQRLLDSAVEMARAVGYCGLGTFEYLVGADGTLAFIEANPRLQVEHTITEEITGVDLVQAQIRVVLGASLFELGLTQDQVPAPRGHAVQLRVNMEKMAADGSALPTGGRLSVYEAPGGPGVRVDGAGFAGLRPSPAFDSLLAKLIVHAPGSLTDTLARARRALGAFRIEGVETNIPYLMALLDLPELASGKAHTRLVEARAGALFEAAQRVPKPATHCATSGKSDDPLAVLAYGRGTGGDAAPGRAPADLGSGVTGAPMQGTILAVKAAPGDTLSSGGAILVMEAMKMQHTIAAETAGRLRDVFVAPGDMVALGDPLFALEPDDSVEGETVEAEALDPDHIRPDLEELIARRALTRDAARPEAVAKRHAKGKRSARENIADLCDDDSFTEYGDLVIAAQRSRRSLDDLMRNTPADGLITGMGTVNGDLFDAEVARCGVLHYDYTVLAGTQGKMNHEKTDRMLHVIERNRRPLIFFCEGGGGRPGDVDVQSISGLHVMTFNMQARLSGLVPMVGIGSGRCFAGNAALLGCCDVVIATRDATIGMGGPAMIEGGGLGVFRPEEVGPSAVQSENGVIDILVEDETEAVAVAKQYLSYFQGPVADWQAPDARMLRHVVPENRMEAYDVHAAIEGMADVGSVLELRAGFAAGMVTALIRVEGRPLGVVANNPRHMAGAIDTPGADKAARFLQLCDAHDLPVVFLCDTPGMMVGPEIEKTALVRHCSRLFVIGSNLEVPTCTFVLRKAYGLGAQAMAGGSFRAPNFVVSWPTGEFGGMGLEGAVKLGYRKELEAVADPEERKALYDKMVAHMYERGKALSTATMFEIDTVIDPAETRVWIGMMLESAPPRVPRAGKKRPWVDTW
ncbi:carboxyl transferase domain-containing protein [Pseudodonghicola sp. IC7]|uniref:Carboxyl transferase domain-containing protein n=1 Tax=Pseudodonghicola flavimaris TaxID=3050036 RepID=A0ABT7F3X2_9RHOB|nr:carboxyl transferase domain-containing protein [Pseudodonghicola flavimaris]